MKSDRQQDKRLRRSIIVSMLASMAITTPIPAAPPGSQPSSEEHRTPRPKFFGLVGEKPEDNPTAPSPSSNNEKVGGESSERSTPGSTPTKGETAPEPATAPPDAAAKPSPPPTGTLVFDPPARVRVRTVDGTETILEGGPAAVGSRRVRIRRR